MIADILHVVSAAIVAFVVLNVTFFCAAAVYGGINNFPEKRMRHYQGMILANGLAAFLGLMINLLVGQ